MKVCGWEIKKMVRDLKFIKIRELIEAILRIINLMVKVFIIGLMGNPIKDNSLKE